jgi:long-chain fatty acid transport protein
MVRPHTSKWELAMNYSLQQCSAARPSEPVNKTAVRIGRARKSGTGSRMARGIRTAALVAGVTFAVPAMATNGYFQIGYGAKSTGMAGAAVANPQDTLASAANPAGMAHVGEGFDVGFRLFSPKRSSTIDCTGVGLCSQANSSDSDNELFAIPDGGYTNRINDKMVVGFSVFGNGGMNTSYPSNLYGEAGSQIQFGAPPGAATAQLGKLGVDLSQLMLTPTFTYQFAKGHTFGVSPVIAVQRFSAEGLQPFGQAGMSTDATKLTNNGQDWSYGLGVRIGWLGEIGKSVRLGATFASKTYMTKLDEYAGLFADGGSFDIPANAAIGIAGDPIKGLTIAADVQRIFYSGVDSIANPGPTTAELMGNISADRRMGASNGIGFGWQDVWIFKIGASYKINNAWTVRAGYNHGESPIPDSEVLINILAPGIVEDHVTLGFSFRSSKKSEWNLSYMHAFERTQTDPSSAFFGSSASSTMSQDAINFSYSRHFD